MDDAGVMVEIVQTIGMWAVFAYLYVSERNRRDTDIRSHIEDLRDIAGIRQRLHDRQVALDKET